MNVLVTVVVAAAFLGAVVGAAAGSVILGWAVAAILVAVGRVAVAAGRMLSGLLDEALIWAAVKSDIKAKRLANLSAKAAARNSKK